jgi:hypothetical protein
MDIRITEQQFAFGINYEIVTPTQDYSAKKKYFSFLDNIAITKGNNVPVATIRGYFSPFRKKHDFIFEEGTVFHFWLKKLFLGVYQCQSNQENYYLYQHHGLRLSLYKDDRQIAAIQKQRVTWGKEHEYRIQADSDANSLIPICMMLTISVDDDNDRQQSTVSIDFGSIGPHEKAYDPNWIPR